MALLIAVGATWLFLAALPALADGGPHVSATNNGSSVLTADSCAGCHRAHTAQGQFLINAASEEALCLTCHGAQSAGATTDVLTGVQYTSGAQHNVAGGAGTQLGALRNGGFDQARIGTPMRVLYPRNAAGDVSARPKVAVGAAEDVNSAHVALSAYVSFTNPGIAWGNGTNGSGAGPSVTLTCASCHNPHGNGQYRILNPMPDPAGVTNPISYTVTSTNATADLISTLVGHQFVVGDYVTLTGLTGIPNGDYRVTAVPDGISLKVNTTFTGAYDISASGSGGTIDRTKAVVDDSPLGTPDINGVYPTKNYTVLQTKGTQSNTVATVESTYLVYASQVITASGSGVFNGINGDYTAAGGDYMHRNLPWNPAVNDPVNCSNAAYVDTTAFPLCAQANDAPNGRPATALVGATGGAAAYAGQVAFSDQITAWCTTCHSRYYANQNPNPTGTDPGSSAYTPVALATISATGSVQTAISSGTTRFSHGLLVGDSVTIAGATNGNGSYTVVTVVSSNTFTVAYAGTAGTGGTVDRTSAPQSASSWWFPRTGAAGAPTTDAIYKYQHRTVPNRACVTCHVGHGSNAQMTGLYSSVFTRPDGTPSASSRLLKADNRGTCQLCHEPTETLPVNTYTGVTDPGQVP
ncbi:MAG: hypothetical protein A2Z32_01645 [Chloroflexi bacterium RBG_16_69_14]|nr:MAG: hypothetical protein A2Z32_01645 [Chloroflexi bacterium RBG_16_69_14]